MADITRAKELLLRTESPEEAQAIINFYEKRQKENNWVQYWQPTPQQTEAIKQFTEQIKIFGVLGGNRSGKTELGAFIVIAWCLGKEYFKDSPVEAMVNALPIPKGPVNCWVVGLDYGTLRDVIFAEKLINGRGSPGLLPKDPQVVTKFVKGDFQIFFENGSIITGKSADAGREKFQSASVDLIWIDEEPEAEIFDECYQRTVDCAGKILLTLTPLTDITSGVRFPWVYDLHEKAAHENKDVKFVNLSTIYNPHIPDTEKQKLLIKWAGHPEERARLYGEFVRRSGLVYPMYNPKVHLIDRFNIPKHFMRVVSIDPAATGMTAAIWAAIDEEGNQYLYREYYEKDRIVSEHAKSIRMHCAGDVIDIWLIDPKWGTQRNAENHKQNYSLYKEAGLPVRLAHVGEDFGLNVSLEYMLSTVTPNARHPKVYIFKDLFHFQHEVSAYTWAYFAKGDSKGLSKEKPTKRNDHLLNAWQYLCAGRFRGKGKSPLTPEELRQSKINNSYTF